MEFQIQRFIIRGLHQTRDYNIEIRDNRIVMVVVNGLGKTTVVNLLYLLLSRQWDRVSEYNFSSLSLTVNGVEYPLTQELDSRTTNSSIGRRMQSELARLVPMEQLHAKTSDFFEFLAAIAVRHGREVFAKELDRNTSIPSSICRNFALTFNLAPRSFNNVEFPVIDELLKQLTSDCQILYLPTYRRIEKDLSLIFPYLEESTNAFQRRKGIMSVERRRDFIELVEFGMEDVETTFRSVQSDLVQQARSELNKLAGGYLRDVIRGEGHTYKDSTFTELDNATVDRVLNRVDEKTLLGERDKRQLRAVIDKLQAADQTRIGANDQYIAHFFSKLISVDHALALREQQIVRFTDVCNKYLSGKEMLYRDIDSSIGIRLLSTGQPLPLRSLSSGEKQIVSLFSHLYLGDLKNVYLIIDEPELSLSVKWQEQLLPDILETGNCKFLAAVTHSPFIFANALDPYAVDLSLCITEDAK